MEIVYLLAAFILCNTFKSNPITSKGHSIKDKLRAHLWMNTTQESLKNNHSLHPIQAEYVWKIMDIFRGSYSVMVLNTPIVSPQFATSVWRKANFKMLIDGGGNVLYDLLFASPRPNCTTNLPHILCGDFDSIRADVLDFFRTQNVEIINTPDQNEPDFFKGLKILSNNTKDPDVIVYCDNVGRLDHIMQNLNVLFKCLSHETLSKYNIFLLSDRSLTWLLRPGFHVIQIPQHLWTENSDCSLIPLGHPCHHVTTRGLKWDLHDEELKFGKMVSSSNTYDVTSNHEEVHVTTDNELIWTMNINEELCM